MKIITFLYRAKKYGKWTEGTLQVSAETPKENYRNIVIEHLQNKHPESRIEIFSIK